MSTPCDRTVNAPAGMEDVLEAMANRYNLRYCCWRFTSKPASISSFFTDLEDIDPSIHKYAIYHDGLNFWAIFSENDAINGSIINDFETNISPIGSPISASSGKDKIKIIKDCAMECKNPSHTQSGSEELAKNPFSPRTNVGAQGTGVYGSGYQVNYERSTLANGKNMNWYKNAQAQAMTFNPSMLDRAENLKDFTQEQWQAAYDWASKQPQWVTPEGQSANWGAKEEAVKILHNEAEFKERKARAPLGAKIISESNTGVESLRSFIGLVVGPLSKLGTWVATYQMEGAMCPVNSEFYPSNDPKTYASIDGIEKSVRTAWAAVTQASSKDNQFRIRRSMGNALNSSRLLTIICNGWKHAAKIQEQSPNIVKYVSDALDNPSHPEHVKAKKFMQSLSAGAIRGGATIPQESGISTLA